VHEAIPIRESRLSQERREPIGEDARMNEDHGLAVSIELVFKLDVAEFGSIHLNPRVTMLTTVRGHEPQRRRAVSS
jgi:hypothetical protein